MHTPPIPGETSGWANARRDGAYFVGIGCVLFLFIGFVLASQPGRPALFDFQTAYYSGKCLLQGHCDPYREADIVGLYSQRPESVPIPARTRAVVTRNIYLPPAFPLTVPLALLPFNLALAIWFVLISGSFIAASFLMWDLASAQAPVLAGALIGFCLANSGSIIFFGNPAGFVVPLTIIAAWCFVFDRRIPLGIACLVVALAFKPHDSGLVWLFFFLAGGVYRRRALQTLAFFALVAVPAFAWVAYISPHWLQEFSSNLHVFADPGGMNDPSTGHGASLLTNLQTITSFFWSNPQSYNLAAYIIALPLFLLWAIFIYRQRPSKETAWLFLASTAALTMLPVYHRQYDSKMILFAVPALASIWSRLRPYRLFALSVTSLAFILNGDIPWAIFLYAVGKYHLSQPGPEGRLLTAAWDFPVPLSLLAICLTFLWFACRGAGNRKSSAAAPNHGRAG